MIKISKNANVVWVGVNKEKLIRDLNKILSYYSEAFNGDIEITGDITASQAKGFFAGGKSRKALDDLKAKTDVFSPVGNFKNPESGKEQFRMKNAVTQRLANKLSVTTLTYFQTMVNKFNRVVEEHDENYNEVFYGNLI